MFRHYFTVATRNIIRNKLYAGINVLGLSLGICACIVIWLVASFELGFDRFHPDAESIYRLGSAKESFNAVEVPPPTPETIRHELTGVESVAAYFPYDADAVTIPAGGKSASRFDLSDETDPWLSVAVIADEGWFSIFHYDWLAGSPAISLSQPFSVVLTESRARKYFGALSLNAILGKELVYEDSLRVYVTGIVRDWDRQSDMRYTDFISWNTIPASFLKTRRHLDYWGLEHGYLIWPRVFLKLAPQVSPSKIDAELKTLAARHIPRGPFGSFDLHLQPLSDIHFNPDYRDQMHKAHLPSLYGVMGIALFILLLAVVNFVNLSTAQSLQRAKEIGIRKVLGSGRKGLVVQFLLETGIDTTLAVVLAVLLVGPIMHFFGDYIPNGVQFHAFRPSTLLFLLAVTLVTTLMAGFYPARVLAGYLPVLSLKGGAAQNGGEKWPLRKSLIVFQFTISLVFIIVALVMGDQISFMLNTDYGLNKDAVVTVYLNNRDSTGKANVKVLAASFREIPGIEQVIRESGPPVVGAGGTSITYKGKTEIREPVDVFWCDKDFIPFYRMKLIAGRNLQPGDSTGGFVINRTLAVGLGFRNPDEALGKFLFRYMSDKPQPIIGVVADFYTGSLKEAIRPVLLAHFPEEADCLGIRLAGYGSGPAAANKGNGPFSVKATIAAMEKTYKKLYPKGDFDVRFMDEYIANLYEDEQKTASVVRAAMVLAVSISCMGLFGLALFTTERRRKEIGIRKVLGASVTDIVTMIWRDFAVLVLLSLLIASPVAWWFAHRWLQDFAYRVPVHVLLFVLAGAGAIGIALLAVSVQSIRAAIVNPIKSLHME
jgi:putative ABC transport system permease protein